MESYNKTSPELCSLYDKLDEALDRAARIKETLRTLPTSQYVSTEELCKFLLLTKRTVQRYRDERIIPYTVIGGKILYPLDRIKEMLSKNLLDPL